LAYAGILMSQYWAGVRPKLNIQPFNPAKDLTIKRHPGNAGWN